MTTRQVLVAFSRTPALSSQVAQVRRLLASQAQVIAASLGKTEPEAVEKMSRRVNQLEKQVKALILTQAD